MATIAALLLAGAVLSDAIANLTDAGDPGTALRWKPIHARAQEMAATSLVESDPAAAARLATAAYGRDPTRAGALRVLGVVKGLRGDEAGAALMLRDAQQLTRRDFPTQLFFIETAVSRGDVAGALSHFDMAMRTSRSARALLNPILCKALQDPGLIRPIAGTLDAVPDWTPDFVNACSDQAPSRPALARVLTLAGQARRASSPVATAKTAQLVALEGNDPAGRQLYEALLRDAGRTPSAGIADPRFQVTNAVLPFDWTYTVTPALAAEQSGGRGAGLDLHAQNRSGIVAWQMMLLRPGAYRLAMTGTSTVPLSGATLVAQVACAGGAQAAVGTVRLPAGPRFAGQGALTVPRGCPSQWLRLSIEGADGGNYEGHVDAVSLTALAGGRTPPGSGAADRPVGSHGFVHHPRPAEVVAPR